MPLRPSRLLAIRSLTSQGILIRLGRAITSTTPSLASPASSSSSTSTGAAASTDPWLSRTALPRPPSAKRKKTTYPDRKTFYHAYYTHLADTAPLTLMFEYDNCSTKLFDTIKSTIRKIPPPVAPFEPVTIVAVDPSTSSLPTAEAIQTPTETPTDSTSGSKKKRKGKKGKQTESASQALEASAEDPNPSTTQVETVDTRATFFMVRSGVLGAVHRARPRGTSLAPWCQGQRAFIICPVMSPPYVGKILSAVKKIIKDNQSKPSSPAPKGASEPNGPKQPALNLLVGLVNGNRVLPAAEVEAMTKIPELDTLRAQVVGMLEGQGSSLVGVLSQAGGGGLVRTLQGLEAGMKESAGDSSA